jgi:protein disulfide-isomerase-like protein
MKYNLQNPTLMLFHATWCGHCIRFVPEFDKFSNNINKSKLNVVKFDADVDKSHVKSFNVEGFPTVLLHDPKTKKFINYNGNRTINDLVKFVNENTHSDITR